MNKLYLGLMLAMFILSVFVLPIVAAPLDEYYLAAFGQRTASETDKTVLYQVTDSVESAHCGTPLKHGLSQDWAKLEPATQKTLAKQLAAPTLPQSLISAGGHFRIHYTTSGSDAPDIARINQYTGLGLNSIVEWAGKVGEVFETVYSYYQTLGYHMPPAIPNEIYLTSLASASVYGFVQDIEQVPSSEFPHASSSFIQIDKDFTNIIFRPTTYTPLQSLQVTAAHEFHHSIQYGYNYFFDIWYGEATSTWFEDEIFDSVNQLYSYSSAWFNNSTKSLDLAVGSDSVTSGAGYSRWLFNRYLADQHGNSMIRNAFESLADVNPVNGQDIPMTPILDSTLSTSYSTTLGADFWGFTKRVFSRDWTSHTADIIRIPSYNQVANYSSYPVSANSTPAPSITLPHYSFAYYHFTPSNTTSSYLPIQVTGTSGIAAAVFKKSGGVISEIQPDASGKNFSVSGFNTLNSATDEVVLLLANITNTDGQSASFDTAEGTPPPPTYTVPGAPAGVTATGGNGQATVSFTAPASNGGVAITGYTVTSAPGGHIGTGLASPISVTGLTNGTAYTFTVTATNSQGTGAASTASTPVTPMNIISKPGDCDGSGTVTIAEVQSAINMFLGIKTSQGCADVDGSGMVSIAEVQKVINSFLGL